jgi:hypothetical protein
VLDTFRGLPVHVLVVHAVVVGVPLMSLVTAVVAFTPRWRARLGWLVVVADGLVAALVLVARLSGQRLLQRIGTSDAIRAHTNLGNQMIWFALALLAAAVLVALVAGRRGALPTGAAVIALVAALAATGWVIRTGEAGSSAVWKTIIANTTAP